jgi:cephalosporin-C deacetylase-like acetyl esterase
MRIRRTVGAILVLLVAASRAVYAGDETLPGTKPVTIPEDIYDRQYKQTEDLLMKRIAQSAEVREKKWKRDFSSPQSYAASLAANRATVAKLIGVGDKPGDTAAPPAVKPLARNPAYDTFEFEFPLYDDVRADAVCLLPNVKGPFPVVIVCHGDEGSPEQMCAEGKHPVRFARRYASNGIAIVAPRFVPRSSDHPDCTLYKKDLRYLIHRFSYVLARHPIGVDVDTVSRVIDALPALSKGIDATRVSIAGEGQGGLTAMYAAALDSRIKSATIVDYFDDRSRAYDEPFDRAIFRHLVEFDDSNVCSLIAPRPLAVVSTKPESPGFGAELASLSETYSKLNASKAVTRSIGDVAAVRGDLDPHHAPPAPTEIRSAADTTALRDKLYGQLKSHFLAMIEDAASVRAKRWANDVKTPEDWAKFVQAKRDAYLDLVGRCDFVKRVPLNPRSEKAYDTADYVGYKILLDVFDGLEAYGILLIPKNIPPGERRPAVICQHGFAGNPVKTIGPSDLDQYYHRFPHTLAQRGYVTFTPYIVVPTEESEWKLDRRAKIVGESRVSICTHQYHAIVDFLQTLGFVDPNRIGYQGLSYGGFTGLWVVSQEPRISPVIVAGYFSDWKARLFDDPKGYMPIRSECMYVWDQMHTFNHSDLASMICPRPFFIEHGIEHGPNWMKWSGSEYRFVESLYTQLGIPDRTQFYAFPGGHETGTEEAFRFLDKWLQFTPKKMPTGVEFRSLSPVHRGEG